MSLDAIYKRDVDMKPHQLGILMWPDNRLHVQCEEVTEFDNEDRKNLSQLALDMIYTMRISGGIGLAAPQVGVTANMFVMTINENQDSLVLINPEVIETSDELFEWEEGCLSVPGYFENRKRPNRVVVRFQDPIGDDHELEFLGLWAFAVQHELDHLKGKVFVDDLSFFKKTRVKSKIKKTISSKK